MKTKLIIATVILLTAFISCNKKNGETDFKVSDVTKLESIAPDSEKSKNYEKQQVPVGKLSPFAADSMALPSQTVSTANPDWDSKIIKTASMKLEIKDFKKYNDFVHSSVKSHGAYVAQEEQVLTDEMTETAITIKVPVAQFENMMNSLPGDDGKVMEKRINTDDVTGEVFDTRSRLEAKKQVRSKYLEFLKQTKNMEEVINVQNEINGIQEQIESAAGRVTFLSHQAAYSTINLTFYQPMEGFQPTDKEPTFLTRLTAAFKNGMGWVGDLLVGLIAVWPLILILIGGYMTWKIIRPKKVITQQA